MDTTAFSIIDDIREAFPHRRSANGLALISGRPLGSEPWEVATAFADKLDWTEISAAHLDKHRTALCFLPKGALCFYLPAYLVADLRGDLCQVDVVFHLLYGLLHCDRETRHIGPHLDGTTLWEKAIRRWAPLTSLQVEAIVRFLERRALHDPYYRDGIDESLRSFWYRRAADEMIAIEQ